MNSFLFEETFGFDGTKVTLIRPVLNQVIRLTISNETVLQYVVHFIGKAYLCPGPDFCPACGAVSKRPLAMLCGGTDHNVGLLEIGSPTLAAMDAIRHKNSLTSLVGTTWTFIRRKAKRPLEPTLESLSTAAAPGVVSDTVLLRSFAKLFSLPRPSAGVRPEDYAASIQDELSKRIGRAVLH